MRLKWLGTSAQTLHDGEPKGVGCWEGLPGLACPSKAQNWMKEAQMTTRPQGKVVKSSNKPLVTAQTPFVFVGLSRELPVDLSSIFSI